jgi:exodeoxyribonuclease X-like protein
MAVRDEKRQGFPISEDPNRPVGPGHDVPKPTSFNPTRLDFGHYAGRTIEELASLDPDYLHWLERHPSGVRYRPEIHRVFGVIPLSTDWER